jgi:hypothetical protein
MFTQGCVYGRAHTPGSGAGDFSWIAQTKLWQSPATDARGVVELLMAYPGSFVVAGLVAAAPLLALAAAAAGGGDWVWLEYPRHITVIAAVLGMAACFARDRYKAPLVLVGTLGFAFAWELVGEYRGLAKFGRTDLLSSEMDLLIKLSIARAAPWLVGIAYSVLALLCITRSGNARTNRVRAGVWLVVVAVVALALTLNNDTWLTLENLGQRGTFISSVAWPDTKKISLVLDLVALAAGVFAIAYRPRTPDRIPRATLQR